MYRLKQQGINLIEVVVTMTITSIGLLGLTSLQLQSIKSTQDSGNRAHAVWIANDIISRFRANEVADSSSYLVADEIRCSSENARLTFNAAKACSAHHNGTDRQKAAADCNANEQARFDLWEALCGFDFGDDTKTSSASYLVNPGIVINEGDNNDLVLTISWDNNIRQVKSRDNAGNITANAFNNVATRSTYQLVFQP